MARFRLADLAKAGISVAGPKTSPKYDPNWAAFGIPEPTPEYRFHPTRRWRFDFAWVPQKLALEVDGGAWVGGRHTRGKGFIADQEKGNAAILLGWRVLHCTPRDMLNVAILLTIREALYGSDKGTQGANKECGA
jgi:hypothetical protein